MNDSPANILQNIDAIIAGLLQLIGEPNNTNGVNIDTVATGSAVITGQVEPNNSSNMEKTASTLSSGLNNGIPGTSYTVTSTEVAAQGTS